MMAQRGLRSKAAYLTWAMLGMTAAGAIAEQASSIARGKDPRDMSDPRFWASAVIRGGSLGPLGDFMYSTTSRPEAWLNITWNYGTLFHEHLDKEQGIRWIYGQKAKDTLSRLKAAVEVLGTDRAPDYWEASAGNAGAALANLIAIGEQAPEGIWAGD